MLNPLAVEVVQVVHQQASPPGYQVAQALVLKLASVALAVVEQRVVQ